MIEILANNLDVIGSIVLFIAIVLVLFMIESEFFTFVAYEKAVVHKKEYAGYGSWRITVMNTLGTKVQTVTAQDILANRVSVGDKIDIVLTLGQFSGIVYEAGLE